MTSRRVFGPAHLARIPKCRLEHCEPFGPVLHADAGEAEQHARFRVPRGVVRRQCRHDPERMTGGAVRIYGPVLRQQDLRAHEYRLRDADVILRKPLLQDRDGEIRAQAAKWPTRSSLWTYHAATTPTASSSRLTATSGAARRMAIEGGMRGGCRGKGRDRAISPLCGAGRGGVSGRLRIRHGGGEGVASRPILSPFERRNPG